MCLKVNAVKLLVKVHLVLPFASVSSKVYSDISKINYSPFKRRTLQEWYLGKDVMNISHKYSGNYRKLASERITYSFQVSSCHLLQSPPCSFSATSHLSSPVKEHPTFCLNEYTQDSYKESSIISCNTNVSICCYVAPGNSLPLCIKAISSLTRRCLKPCLNDKLDSLVLLTIISIFV